jgi:hypothetical protein
MAFQSVAKKLPTKKSVSPTKNKFYSAYQKLHPRASRSFLPTVDHGEVVLGRASGTLGCFKVPQNDRGSRPHPFSVTLHPCHKNLSIKFFPSCPKSHRKSLSLLGFNSYGNVQETDCFNRCHVRWVSCCG